eukprot:344524-Chlamydomonas_euryale.AAC.1
MGDLAAAPHPLRRSSEHTAGGWGEIREVAGEMSGRRRLGKHQGGGWGDVWAEAAAERSGRRLGR